MPELSIVSVAARTVDIGPVCRRRRWRWSGGPSVVSLCLVLILALGHPATGQSPAILRIYLARHGQTDWNAEHRLQGSTDTQLNGTGREQAVKLAERLRGVRLDAVYSSMLDRSRETAEIVRGSVRLEILAGLNERRLGKFEGRRADASDPVTESDYERRSQDPDDTLDGGESLTQFFERVRATVIGLRTQHPSGAILIVGHGGTNQMIVRTLLGLSADEAHWFEQANDELYLIELDSAQPVRLWKLADSGR
jgi:2,3-bisphosphoglycerate-dependent phosphoglycerate mutase